MKLLFVHDGPLFFDKLGNYYEFAYHKLFERYSSLASNISFLMRTNEITKDRTYTLVPKEIGVISVPNFKSISALKNIKKAKRIIEDSIKNTDIIVFRLPSEIGQIGIKFAKKYNKPYIIECVGCAWDSYWNHSMLGKIFAPYAFFEMKSAIKKSKYVYYVTEEFLQRRYPTSGKKISCSNVVLPQNEEEVLIKRLKRNNKINKKKTIIIGTAAALDVRYKGQEYVMKAIAELNKQGYKFIYRLAGGYTSQNGSNFLKELSIKIGIEKDVEFVGSLESDKMNDYYDNIDIYIQPSKQEGLPRSLIEAMSRGCPCIGSNIAGIPELLNKEQLFKKGNSRDLKEKLINMINCDLDEISKYNFNKAKKYEKKILDKKRKEFYKEFLEENFKK